MNSLQKCVAIQLLLVGTSVGLHAQGQRQTTSDDVQIERLRLEAQERARKEEEQRNWDTKIFPIKYVDAEELLRILMVFRANVNSSRGSLRVLTVRAPKEIMPAIEDTIKRFDVPTVGKTAELTIYVLMASDQQNPAGAIPSVLQPVLNQLKTVLAYKSFELVDTLFARGNDGRDFRLSGSLPPNIIVPTGPSPFPPGFFEIAGRFRVDNLDGKSAILRITGLNFNLGLASIKSDVDIPQGQQIVVGKATAGDKAFILVMSAKFPN
jgi:hypothetical protein